MLDFLTYALCPPFSETTDGEYFDALLGKKIEIITILFTDNCVLTHTLNTLNNKTIKNWWRQMVAYSTASSSTHRQQS